ncbi:MAG: anthranilate synthase component I, partial [Arenicellales bacterium]|nr:anthranilate synthase component I [Arenicellales bacterium]
MTTIVDFERFRDEGYNRIPLMREVLADLDTPVSIYLKLAQGRYSYLLESVQGGEKWGRYSIIGLPCRTIVRVTGQRLVIEQDGKEIHSELTADPLAEIQRIQQQFKVPPIKGLPRFSGGLVGYFGYETVRYVEERLGLSDKPDPVLS